MKGEDVVEIFIWRERVGDWWWDVEEIENE